MPIAVDSKRNFKPTTNGAGYSEAYFKYRRKENLTKPPLPVAPKRASLPLNITVAMNHNEPEHKVSESRVNMSTGTNPKPCLTRGDNQKSALHQQMKAGRNIENEMHAAIPKTEIRGPKEPDEPANRPTVEIARPLKGPILGNSNSIKTRAYQSNRQPSTDICIPSRTEEVTQIVVMRNSSKSDYAKHNSGKESPGRIGRAINSEILETIRSEDAEYHKLLASKRPDLIHVTSSQTKEDFSIVDDSQGNKLGGPNRVFSTTRINNFPKTFVNESENAQNTSSNLIKLPLFLNDSSKSISNEITGLNFTESDGGDESDPPAKKLKNNCSPPTKKLTMRHSSGKRFVAADEINSKFDDFTYCPPNAVRSKNCALVQPFSPGVRGDCGEAKFQEPNPKVPNYHQEPNPKVPSTPQAPNEGDLKDSKFPKIYDIIRKYEQEVVGVNPNPSTKSYCAKKNDCSKPEGFCQTSQDCIMSRSMIDFSNPQACSSPLLHLFQRPKSTTPKCLNRTKSTKWSHHYGTENSEGNDSLLYIDYTSREEDISKSTPLLCQENSKPEAKVDYLQGQLERTRTRLYKTRSENEDLRSRITDLEISDIPKILEADEEDLESLALNKVYSVDKHDDSKVLNLPKKLENPRDRLKNSEEIHSLKAEVVRLKDQIKGYKLKLIEVNELADFNGMQIKVLKEKLLAKEEEFNKVLNESLEQQKCQIEKDNTNTINDLKFNWDKESRMLKCKIRDLNQSIDVQNTQMIGLEASINSNLEPEIIKLKDHNSKLCRENEGLRKVVDLNGKIRDHDGLEKGYNNKNSLSYVSHKASLVLEKNEFLLSDIKRHMLLEQDYRTQLKYQSNCAAMAVNKLQSIIVDLSGMQATTTTTKLYEHHHDDNSTNFRQKNNLNDPTSPASQLIQQVNAYKPSGIGRKISEVSYHDRRRSEFLSNNTELSPNSLLNSDNTNSSQGSLSSEASSGFQDQDESSVNTHLGGNDSQKWFMISKASKDALIDRLKNLESILKFGNDRHEKISFTVKPKEAFDEGQQNLGETYTKIVVATFGKFLKGCCFNLVCQLKRYHHQYVIMEENGSASSLDLSKPNQRAWQDDNDNGGKVQNIKFELGKMRGIIKTGLIEISNALNLFLVIFTANELAKSIPYVREFREEVTGIYEQFQRGTSSHVDLYNRNHLCIDLKDLFTPKNKGASKINRYLNEIQNEARVISELLDDAGNNLGEIISNEGGQISHDTKSNKNYFSNLVAIYRIFYISLLPNLKRFKLQDNLSHEGGSCENINFKPHNSLHEKDGPEFDANKIRVPGHQQMQQQSLCCNHLKNITEKWSTDILVEAMSTASHYSNSCNKRLSLYKSEIFSKLLHTSDKNLANFNLSGTNSSGNDLWDVLLQTNFASQELGEIANSNANKPIGFLDALFSVYMEKRLIDILKQLAI